MIFVTVGNHFQSFDRLLRAVDGFAPRFTQEIVIQRGYSRYRPQNAKYFDFVPIDMAMEYMKKSELVISHAGFGTIMLCREYGVPILIVPRRKKYGEHMNDHQMEIARVLEERKENNIYVVYDESQLEEKIRKVLGNKERFISRDIIGRKNLINILKEFIDH
jgi:UDP-N-acetylglucosamine transferase subunit ALG13